jgi:hypothetical protein
MAVQIPAEFAGLKIGIGQTAFSTKRNPKGFPPPFLISDP